MSSTELRKMQPRSLGLLVAGLGALVPLAGIAFLGWDWRDVLIFYWLGNITIGFQVVLSALRSGSLTAVFPNMSERQLEDINQSAPTLARLLKPLMIGFFIMHYGLFTLLHGVFVDGIVSGAWFGLGDSRAGSMDYGQIVALWAIVAATQLSVWLIARGPIMTMTAAYGRIAVLHLSIVFGIFLITWLQWPAAAAVLLVALSVFAELSSALRKNESAPPTLSQLT